MDVPGRRACHCAVVGDYDPVVPVSLEPLFIASFQVHSCTQGAHTCLHLLISGTTPSTLSIHRVVANNVPKFLLNCFLALFSLFLARLLRFLDGVETNFTCLVLMNDSKRLAGRFQCSNFLLCWHVRVFV